MKHLLRRVLFLCVLVVIIVVGFALQPPSQSTESAVVFSNLPVNGNSVLGLLPGQQGAIVVEIPAGNDYILNSFQAAMIAAPGNPTTVQVFVYLDGGTTPTTLLADLGIQPVPDLTLTTLTFVPSGTVILQSGQRYWFVVDPDQLTGWYGNVPNIEPTGIFNLVGYRGFNAGTWNNVVSRPGMAIDADPIVAPPPTGGNVAACTNADSRLNSICEEPWQTAAIYCRGDGAIDVYGITDGAGRLAFRTTQSEIDAVGVPTQNSLIERSDDGKIRLYRLSTGEFQVNSPIFDRIRGNLPDGYVFIFEGCS